MNRPEDKLSGRRVAVVGAAGRLGSAIAKRFAGACEVISIPRVELDLADVSSIRRALEAIDYDLLILSGALTAVDYCETHPDEAFAINGTAPGVIAGISAEKGAHMTYISTDFVFDGSSPAPYHENEIPSPVSVYGQSKLEGEKNVLAVSQDYLVGRVSWLYGPGRPAFPEWIINQALAQDSLALPAEKIGTPTYTEDLVDWLRLLLALEGGTPAGGIFHLTNDGSCSWQQWGQFCLDVAKERNLPLKTSSISANTLDDIKAFAAKRPVNSVLDPSKFEKFTGVKPRPWTDALREHLLGSELLRSKGF